MSAKKKKQQARKTGPKCIQCGRIKAVQKTADGYHCTHCGTFFDDEPDEGGDYSFHNPAARLERAERNKARRRQPRMRSN